jgi:adenylate kinase family enzyme
VQRVSVVGVSGAGKTTFSRALGAALDVPTIELDAIYHLPDWGEMPPDELRATLDERTRAPAWIVDGNYSVGLPLVWARADTVVVLDYARPTAMRRVVARTVRRVVTQQELWNGNREPWSNLWSTDPRTSIVAWAWTRHAVYRARYTGAAADPRWARLRFLRLRSPGEADELLATVSRG